MCSGAPAQTMGGFDDRADFVVGELLVESSLDVGEHPAGCHELDRVRAMANLAAHRAATFVHAVANSRCGLHASANVVAKAIDLAMTPGGGENPLENGEPKPDWKPGTDTIADIRPGSFLERTYEERQRKPDDLEAQEGQRPIAIHALENLAHSDTGIGMLRRLLREQLQRVEQGLDPINVIRDPKANKRIPTGAWNTILSPAEAALPYSEDL